MAEHEHHKQGDSYSNAKARRVIATWLVLTPIIAVVLQKTAFPSLSEWLPFLDLRTFDFFLIFPAGLLFLAFWALFDKFLIIPYQNVLEERERSTTGAEDKAREDLAQAAKLREEFQIQIREVRVEAMEKKLVGLQHARAEAAKLIEQAEKEAEEILRSARWEIATNLEKSRESAKKEIDRLASEVVAKVKSPPQLAEKGVLQ